MEKYIKGKINMSFLKFIKQNTQDRPLLVHNWLKNDPSYKKNSFQ